MPVLKNPKHERFAQELAKGKIQIEAYSAAGYAPNDGNAAQLANRQEIKDRVKEINGRAAERAAVTIESLISEADEIQRKAVEAQQYAAATGALTAKAKLSGLWVDKAENVNRNFDANRLSDAELAEIAASGRSEGATAPPQSAAKPH